MLPAPPPLAVPHWTHRFGAPSNSSNRVRAAAVAFLAEPINDSFHRARINFCEEKKTMKQKKFLKVVHLSNIDSVPLPLADIKNDVIVFDGTASYPPPPISPPPGVSIINTCMPHFFTNHAFIFMLPLLQYCNRGGVAFQLLVVHTWI